ncbi:alpha/beta fold hydrolase [Nocardia inohanensis]|uniref:alpha/beta fold hydrolase n=1 Tax=Nocardia inohanensis TaxID=209246 RepID=UPI00082EC2FC|nr:alpha/beta hydrolase [Nocardia inohanensis]
MDEQRENGGATFVLIHGGGSSSWDWHLVAPELRARGHEVVEVDLPIEDPATGISEYADAVISEVGDRSGVVVVGHSFGGLVAPVVSARMDTELLVLLTAMIPVPGQAPDDWWAASGHQVLGIRIDTEEQVIDAFMHDVPAELAAEAMQRGREQHEHAGDCPIPLESWPRVPTRFLLCRDDRFLPADFMRPLVRERLGIDPDEIDGGHCVMLSRPVELAERLHRYWVER